MIESTGIRPSNFKRNDKVEINHESHRKNSIISNIQWGKLKISQSDTFAATGKWSVQVNGDVWAGHDVYINIVRLHLSPKAFQSSFSPRESSVLLFCSVLRLSLVRSLINAPTGSQWIISHSLILAQSYIRSFVFRGLAGETLKKVRRNWYFPLQKPFYNNFRRISRVQCKSESSSAFYIYNTALDGAFGKDGKIPSCCIIARLQSKMSLITQPSITQSWAPANAEHPS